MLVRIKVDKWKAAKDAMKVVMDHIGNSKSNNGLPGAVIDNISKINENIFINSTEETVGIANNDIDEKVNVTNLTNDEFDAILTEVAPKENSHNLAMFCAKYGGFNDEKKAYYQCNELDISSFDSTIKSQPLLQSILNDFESIQNDLIETKLKQTLIKYAESKSGQKQDIENDIKHLFDKHLTRSRTVCSLFSFKYICTAFDSPKKCDDYISLIERLDNNGNTSMKTFLIIYNAVANVYLKYNNKTKKYGFDSFIEEYKSNDGKNLGELCQLYLLTNIVQTGIYGAVIDSNDDHFDTALESVKHELFESEHANGWKQFEKLMKYCVGDIGSNQDLTKCKEIYQLNTNKEWKWNYGICFYIINRLAFVIFHDLVCGKNSNSNSDSNGNGMMFPDLVKFYQFFYDFSIYIHCYPTNNSTTNQMFYIKQFYTLSREMYDKKRLTKFVYFDRSNDEDGTILHKSSLYDMAFYCDLLLKNDFNPKAFNRFNDEEKQTPFDIATEWEYYKILSMMNKVMKTEDDSKDEKEGYQGEEGKEKHKNEDSSRMDDKSLELRYTSFMNQLVSSLSLLKTLGFENVNQENEKELQKQIQHTLLEYKGVDGMAFYKDHYSDDLCRWWKDMIGLTRMDKRVMVTDSGEDDAKTGGAGDDKNQEEDEEEAINVMNSIIVCVQSLLQLKMVVSDDLLVLCCIYSSYCKANNVKNTKMAQEFVSILIEIVENCLSGKNAYYKHRNYLWFKTFILHSNIWFVRNGSQILFENVVTAVNKQLMFQKEFIWQNMKKEETANDRLFKQLCTFGQSHKKTASSSLRQDKIVNGILPKSDELEMLLLKMKIDDTHKDFDISFENNTKIYLTQCLTYAHVNNDRFQSQMKEYFDVNKFGIKCKCQSAPVICVVKASSDYGSEAFPSGAHILDFMRFSVSFDNIESLLSGVNKFVTDINDDKIECLVADGILRIKNGFGDILSKWQKVDDAAYCDLKLNIIYRNQDNNQCMIVEAQFLLSFLLKAKKMGHKYYGIVRQGDFVENIRNQVYNIDNNYDKYKLKINQLIQNNDKSNLIKQLFWKPNVVISLINTETDGKHHYPLLSAVCEQFSQHNSKMISFFLNCLFHFCFILLSCRNDSNNNDSSGDNSKISESGNALLRRYFNWNCCNHSIVCNTSFWGIETKFIDSKHHPLYSAIDLIMKQDYFDGLSQLTQMRHKKTLIYNCISKNCYYYLLLLSQYGEKNKSTLAVSLNYKGYDGHPLITILKSKTLSTNKKEFLKLYLEISEKIQEIVNIDILKQAIQICVKEKQSELSKIIVEYMHKMTS